MTPEQQREQWLLRILPSLVILVLYFVFISNYVTEKHKEAQQQYETLAKRGISQGALSGLEAQQSRMEKSIQTLEQQRIEELKKLSQDKQFFVPNDNNNDVIKEVYILLEKYGLRMGKETRLDTIEQQYNSQSVQELEKWLKVIVKTDSKTKGTTGSVLKLEFLGSYMSTFHALRALTNSEINVLPVAVSMAPSDEHGLLKWELILKL